MRIATDAGERSLSISIELEEADTAQRGKATIVRDTVRWEEARSGAIEGHVPVPGGWRLDRTHPDLLAAAALLAARWWARRRVVFPFGVSSRFAEMMHETLGIDLEPVDDALAPRAQPPAGRPAVAYSGGVDSSAALSLMPREAVPVFLLRSRSPDRRTSQYRADAALASVAHLAALGREPLVVESDMEWARDPVGIPTDLGWAAPVLLVADALALDSISFGTVLESAFMDHGRRFRDYFGSHHARAHRPFFDALGLPLAMPVAGLSEVMTTAMAGASPEGLHAQSCVRGTATRPCGRCFKCFRKSLIRLVLDAEPLRDDRLIAMLTHPEIRRRLSEHPIHHHDVIAFVFHNAEGSSELAERIGHACGAFELKTDLLRRWYPPALGMVPERHRPALEDRIARFTKPMTEAEIAAFEAWDAASAALPEGVASVADVLPPEPAPRLRRRLLRIRSRIRRA